MSTGPLCCLRPTGRHMCRGLWGVYGGSGRRLEHGQMWVGQAVDYGVFKCRVI